MEMQQSAMQQGATWTKASFALFRQNPSKWMLLALSYVMIFMVIPAIPQFPVPLKIVIGMLWPLFMVLAIGMYREADAKRDTDLGDIVELIKPHIGKLAALGAICLIYGVIINFFTKTDMDALSLMAQSTTPQAPEEVLSKTIPLLLKLLVFLAPLLMVTWFSPMLVAFDDYQLPKAIKSSLAACLQYMLPMGAAWLMLTVSMMLGTMVVGLVAGFLAAFSQVLGLSLIGLVLLGSLLMATAWMLAFQYVSYRDIYKIKL